MARITVVISAVVHQRKLIVRLGDHGRLILDCHLAALVSRAGHVVLVARRRRKVVLRALRCGSGLVVLAGAKTYHTIRIPLKVTHSTCLVAVHAINGLVVFLKVVRALFIVVIRIAEHALRRRITLIGVRV